MFQKLTNEEFLENLKKYNVPYIPLEPYKKAHTKMKFQCNVNPNHIFEAAPSHVYSGNTCCPYCMRTKVFIGETDMWTERPDIAKLLLYPEDGYKYFVTGSQLLDFVCPNCGKVITKRINDIHQNGFSCSYCGDGMSFGEKFISELLYQLDVDFVFNKSTQWSKNRRYDFIIGDNEIIIEVNGIQHYSQSFKFTGHRGARNLEEEKENDSYKKSLAINNGVKYYIELDCRNSDYEFVKQSVLDSELSILYDLSIIDWNKCFEATGISNVKRCADLWNSGMKNTKEISEEISMDRTSVIGYLKRAKTLGLCDYELNYKKNKSRYKPVICLETKKIYEYAYAVSEDGYLGNHVLRCCNGLCETAYGLHWRFV